MDSQVTSEYAARTDEAMESMCPATSGEGPWSSTMPGTCIILKAHHWRIQVLSVMRCEMSLSLGDGLWREHPWPCCGATYGQISSKRQERKKTTLLLERRLTELAPRELGLRR